MVSPNEGNEVRRKGRQEVGASRSTADPGEPPEGPWGGKGAPSYEPLEGNMPGTPRPDYVSTKRQRIAELARIGQRRPALRAGRMVREGRSPPPERRSLRDPLCGRLRDRGSARRRRPANHGGLTQADEQVRPDGPPGEDTPGAVPTAPSGRFRHRGTGTPRRDDIRLLGIHPLLGPIPARRMGG